MRTIAGILFLFIAFLPREAPAQAANLGLPPVAHFPKSTYQAGTQSWEIAQDRRGVILLANNEGLLSFDGSAWKLFPIANKTCVRSICVADSGRVYAGGQGEFGFFEPDANGILHYTSLLPLIDPAARNFADVWDIVPFEGAWFFRTADRVFRYAKGAVRSFSFEHPLEYMAVVHGRLLLHQQSTGICRFQNGRFEPVAGARPPGVVTGMLPWTGDTVLVATLKNGFYSLSGDQFAPWQTRCDNFLKEKRIYTAALMPDRRIAVGTTLGGLVLLDTGRRPLLWLRKGGGLQNNNILCLSPDRAGNLWLGLDNGIDYVEINAPFYRIVPDGELEGAGYVARLFDGNLYLGTSNGLFATPWQAYFDPFDPRPFQPVEGATGQVWGLNVVGNRLLMGHHEGAFRVQGRRAELLSGRTGTWLFAPLSDTLLVAGQYDGLSLFGRPNSGGNWALRRKLSGLDESSRIMAPENDTLLWMSHPYRGVFRIAFRKPGYGIGVRHFGQAEGLPSDLFNYVFRIGGRPVVAAEHGIFRFDAGAGRFVPQPEFESYLGPTRTRYLQEDPAGNIWFANETETGVLWVRDEGLGKKIRKQVFSQLSGQLVGGFEHIYPLDAQNLFFGTEKGFLYLATRRLAQVDTGLNVLISSVSLTGDSLLYGGFSGAGPVQRPRLPFSHNSLHLQFAATSFGAGRHIEYATRLDGLEDNWSAWSPKMERDFAHLPPGKYVFLVKARDEQGRESAPAEYEWRILPPWYASPLAYAVYGLLVLVALFLAARLQRRRFDREKDQMAHEHRQKEEQHRQRAEQSEQELVRVRNEKLEAEVLHKNEELALATMHLVQKGEMLASIQEALERVLEHKQMPATLRDELRRVLRLLQMDTRTDQDWEQFAVHFDQVYGDFLKRLRERSPQLSPNDYRLCAYLRMNLNTKEIAHLMNISVRGVEGSRYRLRRKLNLHGEENLVDYLMNV